MTRRASPVSFSTQATIPVGNLMGGAVFAVNVPIFRTAFQVSAALPIASPLFGPTVRFDLYALARGQRVLIKSISPGLNVGSSTQVMTQTGIGAEGWELWVGTGNFPMTAPASFTCTIIATGRNP